jgi:hypothetical protein
LSLAPLGALRDNSDMTPHLTLLLLPSGAFHALTFALVLYMGFPHPHPPFARVGTVLLLSVCRTLAPLVVLPLPLFT